MAVFGSPGEHIATTLLNIWIGVTATVIVLFVLEIQGALTGGNTAARHSVHEMFAGRLAVYFYGGTLLLGLIVPLALVSEGLAPLSLAALAAIGLFSALGDFFMKYTTIRAGVYLPLNPRPTRRR
jgi:formate-dependent nitrite reductase membrane component NrfD